MIRDGRFAESKFFYNQIKCEELVGRKEMKFGQGEIKMKIT